MEVRIAAEVVVGTWALEKDSIDPALITKQQASLRTIHTSKPETFSPRIGAHRRMLCEQPSLFHTDTCQIPQLMNLFLFQLFPVTQEDFIAQTQQLFVLPILGELMTLMLQDQEFSQPKLLKLLPPLHFNSSFLLFKSKIGSQSQELPFTVRQPTYYDLMAFYLIKTKKVGSNERMD